MTSKRVLVVGGGIAGLTLGIALRRAAIEVDLAEIRSDVAHQAGVGLSLQGNALAALARLGLADRCLKVAMPSTYINLRRPDGTLLVRQPVLAMGGPDFPGTAGISRQDLHAILLEAARAAGVNLRLGLSYESFANSECGVEVHFSDGSRGRYELMVGADGVNSRTRAQLFPLVRPQSCGQAIWRAGVTRPPTVVTTELHVGGPFGVVGICPVSDYTAYLYILETASPQTRYADDQLAAVMTSKLAPYTSSLVRTCVMDLMGSTAITYRHLEWLLIPPPWFRGRVLVIGDAAHCNPPVLAQGAAMGIEDAVVLAELLEAVDSIDEALDQFVTRRHPRASLVVKNSVQLSEWEVKHLVGAQQVGQLMLETQVALSQPF